MVEDSQRQTEESEQSSDSSSKEKTEGCETVSESLSNTTSDPEPKDGIDGSKLPTADPKIQKQETVNDAKDQATETPKPENTDGDHDHSFNLHEIIEHDLFDSIRSRKDQILRYTAAAIGVILIIYGIVMISASVTKVADNVIFGEGASFAAFSILLGFLIIVAAFSQKILNKTFLKNISSELEIAEGKTESKDKNTDDADGKKDPKKGKDNNGNIVGEDKK